MTNLQSNTIFERSMLIKDEGRTHDVDIEGNIWKEAYEFVTMEDELDRFTISTNTFTQFNLQNK